MLLDLDGLAVAKVERLVDGTRRTISSIREPEWVEPSSVNTLSTGGPSRPALRTRAYSETFRGSFGKVRPWRSTRG
ncbi:hypothetical protein [Streptomyces sp. NPDC057438]|uniref:hypothetical protein n=1 Tax=Streptomyces sp. NPDC057438 TaxID=3346133 RepID=UPI0036CD6A1A